MILAIENTFEGRNLSKLRLNDIDNKKKQLKKEYNEQELLSKMGNMNVEEGEQVEEEKENESENNGDSKR